MLIEIYKLLMPTIIEKLQGVGSNVGNENLFLNMDIIVNILKDLVSKNLHVAIVILVM